MDRTVRIFSELSRRKYEELMASFYMTDLFLEFEKGLMKVEDFREEVNQLLGTDLPEDEFDGAWNAMLLDIPPERIELLRTLGRKHKMFLISNTNAIHVPVFNRILKASTGVHDISELFDGVYYSHEVFMRKPDQEIFQYVLDQHDLKADETLLIDDRLDNLEGAASLGIKGIQITEKYSILDHFNTN
jgi:putative hydrolase of the HAD superfamily